MSIIKRNPSVHSGSINFDNVVAFARQQHQHYLNDLLSGTDPDDFPLPHMYLFDSDNTLSVFALALSKDASLQYLNNLRLTMQAKILLEAPFALVYCGIVLSFPVAGIPPDLKRTLAEKEKTDPNFLETMEREYGLVLQNDVIVTAESAANTFVRTQRFFARDKTVHLDGDANELFDRPLPHLTHCDFAWPGSTRGTLQRKNKPC
jgi:hypothetical protein